MNEESKKVFDNIPYNYKLKSSCMTPTESYTFFRIQEVLQTMDKKFFPKRKSSSLYLFPQISLHSFIEITGKEQEYYKAILSKNVDYLICFAQYVTTENKKALYRSFYRYEPLIAIELDGKNHIENADKLYASGKGIFKTQRENDDFKDRLFSELGIKLIRLPLTENRVSYEDYGILQNSLSHELEFLLPQKITAANAN